jgi:hypothetical protein
MQLLKRRPGVAGGVFLLGGQSLDADLPAVEEVVAVDLFAGGRPPVRGEWLRHDVALVGLGAHERFSQDHQKVTPAISFLHSTTAKAAEVKPPVVTVTART